MKRFALTATFCVLAAVGFLATAQDKPKGFRGDALFMLADAEKKCNQLLEATPDEKMSWRPGAGVRSAGEVYLHIAGANYGVSQILGHKIPAGTGFAIEKKPMSKTETAAALKQSFGVVNGAITAASDADLAKAVKLFGMDMTHQGAYLILVSHAHEHLGQSIAYARMNGIVPPWSRKE